MKPEMKSSITHHEGGAVSFSGREAVGVYQAIVIASALDLYAKTGIKANRSYTPTAMMRSASGITGLKFKSRDYAGAALALREFARKVKEELQNEA